MARFSLLAFVFVFASPVVLALSNYAGHPGPHGKLARSHASGNLTSRTSTSQRDRELHKRFDNARCTLFETGLGACGATNSNSDFIVALNVEQFGSGDHCFDTITITYNGKSTQAQIVDRCEACPFGGIDLTPSLFEFFAPTGQGVIYATWDFGSGSPPPTTTSQPPPPSTTSTSTWSPEPTTSSAPPPPPSTSSEPPTTSSTSTSSSSSSVESTSSSVATSTSASTSAVATPTESSVASVIDLINLGSVQLGRVIAVAAAAQVNLQTSDS